MIIVTKEAQERCAKFLGSLPAETIQKSWPYMGRVIVSSDDRKIDAVVYNSVGNAYTVSIKLTEGKASCTCPHFKQARKPCKHMAAVAAVYIQKAASLDLEQFKIEQAKSKALLFVNETLKQVR